MGSDSGCPGLEMSWTQGILTWIDDWSQSVLLAAKALGLAPPRESESFETDSLSVKMTSHMGKL